MAVGQTIITIRWKFKNQTYTSKAVANNKKGIIYDNIGSNVIFIPPKKGMKVTSSKSNDKLKKQKVTNQFNSSDLPPCVDISDDHWNPRAGCYVIEEHSTITSPEISIYNVFVKIGTAQAELLVDGYILDPMGGYPEANYLT